MPAPMPDAPPVTSTVLCRAIGVQYDIQVARAAGASMKITRVESIYVRLPRVQFQCDSGQDALIVRIETDAGVTGIGEVDSSPLAAKGAIDGPFSHTTTSGLAHLILGEDPFETEKLWHRMYW